MQKSRNRATTVVFIALSLLAAGQMLAAARKTAISKDAQARVVYSGQFKGQVEPCG